MDGGATTHRNSNPRRLRSERKETNTRRRGPRRRKASLAIRGPKNARYHSTATIGQATPFLGGAGPSAALTSKFLVSRLDKFFDEEEEPSDEAHVSAESP